MAGILLTQNNTFIIGDVAKILGWIMDVLFNFLNSVFGIQNIGLCIILFTVIIYLLMLPLTIKQQKFSKLSAKMNPEIQEIQKKYKNKKDNTSMMAMNEETQAVYAKYGVSATGSCLQMLIQLPILFALYRVIMNVPAYVGGVKNVFTELAGQIMAAPGGPAFMQELQTNGRMFIEGKDFNEVNTIIDVLYKLQDTGSATWQMLIDKFPEMESLILTTQSSITSMNNFGINIANSPWNIAKSALAAGSFIMLIGAVLVPFLAALTQWLNVKPHPLCTHHAGRAVPGAAGADDWPPALRLGLLPQPGRQPALRGTDGCSDQPPGGRQTGGAERQPGCDALLVRGPECSLPAGELHRDLLRLLQLRPSGGGRGGHVRHRHCCGARQRGDYPAF